MKKALIDKPVRLTREEAQQQTRERLLEAAQHLFVRFGFNGTSLRDIATHAGYSQGAFYSNFRDKEEVLLALLARHKAEATANAAQMIAGMEGSAEEILSAVESWTKSLDDTPTWCVLSVELQLQAARDTSFATHYHAFWQTQREDLAKVIGLLFDKLDRTPPAPLLDLADLFMACSHGVALQKISNPHAHTQTNGSAMIFLLKALLAQSS